MGANACRYEVATDAGMAAVNCTCVPSAVRNDAGMRIDRWNCMRVIVRPDAGALSDTCPANNVANNGNCAAFVTGLVCPGVAGRECTCRALGGGGGVKLWNCAAPVDAGRGGG